ncbi:MULTISPECIES: hypothetical protein [Lactobacillus]|nr:MULTISPECIES: hypothetical protein [Lactobacillus]MCT7758450.1 hypothetical protein [Lactobacillus gasseri]MDT9589446.1 hypothetical protein [Lactobacillus paragasseri]MDU3654288.1 hypothetical protein [Lactobacillus gasseri]MDX5099908.1 hypothetical protein [Lactobacillus paragasseri]MDX5124987.1 hypothetical protein [Lactobacillus paragasseri]
MTKNQESKIFMTNSNSSISKHYHQLTSLQRGQIQAVSEKKRQ